MSEAVAAACGTATPDWMSVAATADGGDFGETDWEVTACCCDGWLDWLESAAIRADAAPLPEAT